MNAVSTIAHVHAWHIAEIEFIDSQAVRRYECGCGATDYAMAG
ncbi:MAG: hypothetical protein ACTHOG_08530 [Marmoricola sp.]